MNTWKELLVFVVAVLIFFGMLIFTGIYNETMREECRLAGIHQNYTAIEVQAICN